MRSQILPLRSRSIRTMALTTLLLSLPSSVAFACHNGVEHAVNPVVRLLRRAERDLARGHLRRAFRRAQRASRDAARNSSRLRDRGKRVMAVAAVRLRGDVPRISRGGGGDRTAQNLAWATRTLRRLHEALPHDVVLAARLAEALSYDEATQREAYDLLLPLRNVLPDTFALRTMAVLFERFGEDAQSARALRECMRRAHGPGRGVCRPIS